MFHIFRKPAEFFKLAAFRFVKVEIRRRRQLKAALNSVQSGVNNETEREVRICKRIGRAKLGAPVFAVRRRNSYELGAVLVRPGNISRRLKMSETLVGIDGRIEKYRHVTDLIEYSGNRKWQFIRTVLRFYGKIDMKSVSGLIFNRLGSKIRIQTVSSCNGFNNGTECHRIVRRSKSVGIMEIYLVLSGTLLVVGAFGENSHLLKRQAYLTSDVFASVLGSYIHISCVVVGRFCGISVFVKLE